MEKIRAVLIEMQCEMDKDDIAMEEAGSALDDVFCADGQQDIKMNAGFEMTSVRKE